MNSEKNLDNNQDFEEIKIRKWLQILLMIIAIIISIILLWKAVMVSSNIFGSIRNSIQEEKDEWDSEFNDTGKMMFNSNFEFYTGTKLGMEVGYLLDEVIKNNKTNKNHLIEVEFDNYNTTDSEDIKNLKKNFNYNSRYEVSVDYNENGYIYKVKIEKL